ncbi:MAG TPA: hypothetical protein VGU73_07670 [Acidimicrobiia bacterium]|nr:hypothetical protein [Acidimicrobiia bacterium]
MDSASPAPYPMSAYPSSAIHEFVLSAAEEQNRLEQAISDARARERIALRAAEETELTARLVRSSLHDLRREFGQRRLEVEAEVSVVISAAQDEAAAILAAARDEARRLAGTAGEEPGTRPQVAPEKTYRPPAAPPLAPSPSPAAEPDPIVIDLSREPDEGAVLTALRNVPPAPAVVDAAEPVVVPVGAGANGFGVADNGDTPAIDTAEGRRARSRGIGSLLRRGRTRSPESDPAEEASDEYLDFLRGALLDDSPLSGGSDDDPPDVVWRQP